MEQEVGRDRMTGRFAPGWKGGPGSGLSRRQYELRKELVEAQTPEYVRAVGKKLLKLALDGDVQAARVWLEYVVGKPTQAVEISGPDGAALDLTSVVSVIMLALGDDQAARVKVAAAFRQLGRVDGDPGLAQPRDGS